ncbi:polysaccharide lyase-like protein [Caulobacter sp. BK020]|nr:polysaccharide lyase-like protein [Caulobacter sp. BK020]
MSDPMADFKTHAAEKKRPRRWIALILGGSLALASIVAAAAMSTQEGRGVVVDAADALKSVPRHLRTESNPELIQGENPRFQVQNAGQPWNYAVKGASARFEVRPGDSLPGDGKIKERSEIATSLRMKPGRPYEVAFNLMIEPGPPNTAGWMTLSQIQSTPDPGEPGHSPPFAIEMVGERMRIITRDDPNRVASRETTTYRAHYTDSRPIERGRWYRMLIRVKFGPGGDGYLQVFRDGQQLVDYRGPLGFDDIVGPYWKEGVYREAAKEPFAARFRNLSITPG